MSHFDELALGCALLSYGSAKEIVKTLERLPLKEFTELRALDINDFYLYRFQSAEDIFKLFNALQELAKHGGLKQTFLSGFNKSGDVLDGIKSIQKKLLTYLNPPLTRGLSFLIGALHGNSPLKRYLMFLRWMVRRDNIDLGLWDEVPTNKLLLPLDTHTLRLTRELGLLQRKSYDIKAVREVSSALLLLDEHDPIKYDFALYRIGQEGIKQEVLRKLSRPNK